MILKQLTVKNTSTDSCMEINFNTAGLTVISGDGAEQIAQAMEFSIFGVGGEYFGGNLSTTAILGYDGKEMILNRELCGGRQNESATVFGFREDSYSMEDIRRTIFENHTPAPGSDRFSAALFSAENIKKVIRAKIEKAKISNSSIERQVEKACRNIRGELEKKANQTIMSFRFLCEDNDISGFENFGGVAVDEKLNYKIQNDSIIGADEKYIYSLLFFFAEVETIRKTFARSYCDFVIADNFMNGVDEKYIPAVCYFASRFRCQVIVSCNDSVRKKMENCLPPETIWYNCGAGKIEKSIGGGM